MSSQPLTSYDLVPYPHYTFPQTHPDRAAAVAALLGLSPPPVEHCRVLELGCAAGSNLLPMAEELPQSSFVGLDLSSRQTEQGRKWVAEVGLSNLELRCQSILDFEPGSETFDYMICHGVYSWVPPEVQERILAIARHSLQPNGIAYVSYNTLPGWHMRGMIRDMMIYHSRRFSQPQQQINQARQLLSFLVSAVPKQDNPYGQILRAELEGLGKDSDSYLFHELLEEHNSPLYFHQFVERATAHGLRYLADVDLHLMDSRNFPPQIHETLARVSSDLIQAEQYMDFLRNRTFRQTLLCHAQHTPQYGLDPHAVQSLFIGSPLRPSSAQPDLHPLVREDFKEPDGAHAFSYRPIVKAALLVLGEAWPQHLPFAELYAQARARLEREKIPATAAGGDDELQLGQSLLRFHTIAQNLVEFRLRPLPATNRPGPQPLARPLARWLARTGRPVINLRHQPLPMDKFGREILSRLDGQHTRTTLAQELVARVRSGELTLPQDADKVAGSQPLEQFVPSVVEERMEQFARLALLLG